MNAPAAISPSQPLSPPLTAILASSATLVIGNDVVGAADGATFETFDPSTGTKLASVAHAQAADVEQAVQHAQAALDGEWGKLAPAERVRLINKLADKLEQENALLAQLESLNNGTPLSITGGLLIPGAAAQLRFFAGLADKLDGALVNTGMPDMSVQVTREPVGVVAAIVPWNFPLTLAVWKVAPALAAGCAVILKPAEQTPLTAVMLGKLALEVGFPPGALQVLTGFGDTTGAALVDHPGVHKVAFTGSVDVGRTIARAAANTVKRVTLELGGKSPSIVLDDADLDVAIASVSAGIFFNSGQVCSASSRLLVAQKVFDKVVDGVVQQAEKQKVGSALDAATTMGPLISERQVERVGGYVRNGVKEGARVVCGGRRLGEAGNYFAPTVVVDAPAQSRIAREEIFGPVVVASAFDSVESVAAAANNTPFGLAAAIFTRNMRTANKLAKALKAGNVWINTYGMVHPAVPFGGYKMSGTGRDGGVASINQYLETKAIWTNYI